jgi:hypothetical protein
MVIILLVLFVPSFGISVQPPPGEGTVFVTRVDKAPNGALLRPIDLGISAYTTILDDLSFPEIVTCYGGRLYLTETFAESSVGAAAAMIVHRPPRVVETPNRIFHRILRTEQDGSGKRFLVEWDKSLQPSTLALSSNGDLYIGSTSEDGKRTAGVWRIRNADTANENFSPLEQVLRPESFLPPTKDTSYSVRPIMFLNQGPFAEDLLLIDAPVQSFIEGGRVLRAIGPNYDRVEPFIPAFIDPETERPFKPASLAIDFDGSILVTDFANDKILRYSSEGVFIDVFGDQLKSPNQIAVGKDGLVYVTNTEFRGRNVTGGLFIYSQAGELLEMETSSIFLRGVTVCGS